MTARELMDAAWEAAHVPEDGIIPVGAEYVARSRENGVLRGPLVTGFSERDADDKYVERRLVNPPAPKGAGGAAEIEALVDAWKLAAEPRPTLPDFLASRGVRVVTEDDGGDETPEVCPHIGGPGGDCGCPL